LVDPTKAPEIKAMMKGLRSHYQKAPKKARPLGFGELKSIVEGLHCAPGQALVFKSQEHQRAVELSCLRDKAFFLLGFWCGWRGDELIRLQAENAKVMVENGRRVLHLYLPYTKGDRDAEGAHWRLVELPQQCPVNAYLDWIEAAFIKEGPVFCAVNRWGQVSEKAIHSKSIIKMMRDAMVRSGMEPQEAESYSSHSLRRGFANFAIEQGASAQELMDWVGWKEISTAIAYLKSNQSLHQSLLSKAIMPIDDE